MNINMSIRDADRKAGAPLESPVGTNRVEPLSSIGTP